MKIAISFLFLLICSCSLAQNFQTHKEVYGEGFPILLINGGPGFSSEGFRDLAEKLSTNNQVIIYDQRGTGQSHLEPLNSETITMDLMVEDIENLRKEIGFNEWIVMGHSFGGMLASYYTSLHPEKVTSLILSGSGGLDLSILGNSLVNERLTIIERDSLNYWRNRIQEGDNSEIARKKRARFLAPAYLENKDHIPIIAERLTQGNMRLNGLVWRDMRRIEYDVKEEMSTFEKPVLILHGEFDVVDPISAKEAHTIFPNSKLVIMPDCSHYGWLDQPDIFFSEISSFLAQFS